MYLNSFYAILQKLFRRYRKRALCPVRVRVVGRSLLIVAAILSARQALATVAQSGDVQPADNPFSANGIDYEGLPQNGNTVDAFELPAPGGAVWQTFYEGIPLFGPDATKRTADDTNPVNFTIYVGKTTFGSVVVRGGSQLRDEDLIIRSEERRVG